jgi:hypothetical protein
LDTESTGINFTYAEAFTTCSTKFVEHGSDVKKL